MSVGALRLTLLAHLRVSAASGLVRQGQGLWVVADDALVLQHYDLGGNWLRELTLLPGTLPADEKKRKKRKPDFEALLALPDGALLALGSGSKAQRQRGCLVRGDEVQVIDLAPLYEVLAQQFQELNIEGAVIHGEQLILAQRGNGAGGENALVFLDRVQALTDIAEGRLTSAALQHSLPVTLSDLHGVPLSLTDLCISPAGQLYFSAAAEATDSSYLDGQCMGSVLGRFTKDFAVEWLRPLVPTVKIEGLAFQADGRLLMVADADDPEQPAPLFALDRV
ncbi:hypothetical protein ACVW0Y_002595 [Pseudomonas sp. TE3786]